ncbi:MAG: T9SS type A sorting domain-containing protein [Bacteroidota bacterium]
MKHRLLIFAFLFFTIGSAMAIGHTVSISSTTNVSCFASATGSITASVSGGVGPFTYNWTPSGGTNASATNLAAGSYTVTVTDQNDLSTATATATITQPTSVILYSNNATSCSNPVTLNAFGVGGNGQITYSWNPGALSGSSVTVSPTSNTTYTITGTDAIGCTGATTAKVTVAPAVTATITGTNTICSGGSATLTAGGGNAYIWNTGETSSSITVTPSTTTTYTVVAATASCADTATYVVAVPCVGVEEQITVINIVKVYPNPFIDKATITIQSDKLNESYTFELIDILGTQVSPMKEINSKEFHFLRNGLSNGIYFYKISNAESIMGIGKLIIK